MLHLSHILSLSTYIHLHTLLVISDQVNTELFKALPLKFESVSQFVLSCIFYTHTQAVSP